MKVSESSANGTETSAGVASAAPPRRSGFSLKYKLLGLLILLPALSLGGYFVLATRLFESDKIAYIFDSNASLSKTLAAQARSELSGYFRTLQAWIRGFNFQTGSFDEKTMDLFQKNQETEWISLYSPTATGAFVQVGEISKDRALQDDRSGFYENQFAFLVEAREREIAFMPDRKNKNQIYVALRLGDVGGEYRLVVTHNRLETFLTAFQRQGSFLGYLATANGDILAGPDQGLVEGSTSFKDWSFFKELKEKNLPEGTQEFQSPSGETLLASFSQLDVGGLMVISFVKRSAALRALELLYRKSLLFFFALIAAAMMVAVLAASALTSKLRELYQATQKVAEGQFDISIQVASNDEVGDLARSFNLMAMEVGRLLRSTADKARLEKELETAKTVQETLFPLAEARLGNAHITGSYTPASECGGDWWHYCEMDGKVWMWLGDATGHGAPAALITSAAKSAVSILEGMGGLTPGKALELLNKAIQQTSKGKMLMTFFCACYDPKEGILTYANASHDPPYLMKHNGQKLKKKDIITLNEVVSPRLGQDMASTFDEARIEMSPQDVLLIYTDGLNDVKSPADEIFGERNVIKIALNAVNEGKSAADLVKDLQSAVDDYRKGTPLDDDVTYMVCRIDAAA
ncbi:MAG: SpoIIE family protein phosphatase [Bdellovibrionales bacterium]|nr:SpoIIE family protein phosphatase [Bdellovibrionales bacterium]